MGSLAVSINDVASVVGYLLQKGNFNPSSPNLPQNISILAEANSANQAMLSTSPQLITSAIQAAALYGYGSPIHAICRILFPQNGQGPGVPVTVYPQLAAPGATPSINTVTAIGTATASGTVYLNICGREQIDGASYAVNIVTGDTPTVIANKMQMAAAAVLACPITANTNNVSGIISASNIDVRGTGYVPGNTFNVSGGTTAATGEVLSVNNGSIATAAVEFGGPVYAVNDTFVVNYGGTNATGKVTAVTNGIPTAVQILTGGAGYSADAIYGTTATSGVGAGMDIVVSSVDGSGAITGSYIFVPGGTTYAVNDTFNILAPAGGIAATGKVSAVTNGAVTGITLTFGGADFVAGTNYNTTATSGVGSGLIITCSTVSNGVVNTYVLLSGGAGNSVAANVATTATTGIGTGLTLNITGVYNVTPGDITCVSKWAGATANDITISVDLGTTNLGVSFVVNNVQTGVGVPNVNAPGTGLALFGSAWNTLVINGYGMQNSVIQALEQYNGIPDPVTPTGQYAPTVWKPMLALTGTTLDNPTSITGAAARQNQVTIVACVAPDSLGMQYEAAANYAYVLAGVMQNSPQSGTLNMTLPDMPGPAVGVTPSMNNYAFRNTCVTNGCSTAELVNGVYVIKDLVTTYNMSGEYPPYYRYVRDLNVYFNYKFGYFLLVKQNQVGKTLVPDSAIVTAANTLKPKQWTALVAAYNKDCEARALIVNADVNNKTIVSSINSSNPNRMDTTEDIQISGLVLVSSNTITGGFNFTS